MDRLEIEKNIPMPATGNEVRRKYPFAELEVGDSFFVLAKDMEEANRRRASIRTQFRNFKPKHFIARLVDNGALGVRVWRDK